MEATTIAWVLPHEGHDDEAAIAALRAQGLRVLACASGAALPAEAGVRVLRAELFGDARRLRREYLLDARPTLIVVATAEQEAATLEFLKARDDVVRGLQPLEQRARRIDHHDPGVEAVGHEEVGRRREPGALEQIVDVADDDGIGVEEDDPLILAEIEGAQLGEARAEPAKQQLVASVRVRDRRDLADLPALRGEPGGRPGRDVRGRHHDARDRGAGLGERTPERLEAGYVGVAAADHGDIGVGHGAPCIARVADIRRAGRRRGRGPPAAGRRGRGPRGP